MSEHYQFDIFVSYKREPVDDQLITPWLQKVIRRVLYWVKQELGGRETTYFLDTKTIPLGSPWPDVLRAGLIGSRCLFAVWSPEYFQSPWCVAEWRSFRARAEELGPAYHSLVVPVSFHDGQHFPEDAQHSQAFDLSRYTATTEAFWATPRADELDTIIRVELAAKVAEAINLAPEDADPNWPVCDPTAPEPPPPIQRPRW